MQLPHVRKEGSIDLTEIMYLALHLWPKVTMHRRCRYLRRHLEPFVDCLVPESAVRQYFFTTEHGLCGFCMQGAKIGDRVSVFSTGESEGTVVPLIVRPHEDEEYSMVCVAWLQDGWEDLVEYLGNTEPQNILIR